jgi:hypothetical protein
MFGSVNSIISYTFIILGVYLTILIFRARFTGFVNNALLWDRTKTFDQCSDKEGFLHYLFPRGVFCAAAMIASGIFSLMTERYKSLRSFSTISLVITIVVFFYYIYIIQSAMKKYY